MTAAAYEAFLAKVAAEQAPHEAFVAEVERDFGDDAVVWEEGNEDGAPSLHFVRVDATRALMSQAGEEVEAAIVRWLRLSGHGGLAADIEAGEHWRFAFATEGT